MDQLRRRLEERLAALEAAQPGLAPALTLQRTLLNRQMDLLDAIRLGGLPGLRMPPRYVAAKLKRGIPALHDEPLPLPSRLLALSAREFCDHLARGGAGEAAAAVGRALDQTALEGAALISACFRRDQQRVRFMAARQRVSADITWLVAELAAAPYAHLLQGRALCADSDAIAEAVGNWDRGFCPACGSWPALVEAIGGTHVLRCSFCGAGWTLSSYRCLYCANDAETFVTMAPDAEQTHRRLQACAGCGGYVKVLGLEVPTAFPLVAVEDLASMDLDMVAIERQYMRPALPEIRKSHSGS